MFNIVDVNATYVFVLGFKCLIFPGVWFKFVLFVLGS